MPGNKERGQLYKKITQVRKDKRRMSKQIKELRETRQRMIANGSRLIGA